MAGSVQILDSAALIVADRVQTLKNSGAHRTASFFVNVTAITRTTGTLTVGLYWSKDGTVAGGIKIAEITGLTATGIVNAPLVAPFLAAGQQAIPEPNVVIWDIIGDTTNVSGTLYGIFGD